MKQKIFNGGKSFFTKVTQREQQMKKIFHINNIPSPYRISFFNEISRQFKRNNFLYSFIFLAKTGPNRKWKVDEKQFKFGFKFLKGFSITINFKRRSLYLHFKFGILWLILKHKPDYIIMGGYMHPVFFQLLLYKLFFKFKLIMWSEG